MVWFFRRVYTLLTAAQTGLNFRLHLFLLVFVAVVALVRLLRPPA
jgi:hypothetical protein